MSRKLYEVTVTRQFYWFGEEPPTASEVRSVERDIYTDDADIDITPTTSNTLCWDESCLPFGDHDDVTIAEALEEVNR